MIIVSLLFSILVLLCTLTAITFIAIFSVRNAKGLLVGKFPFVSLILMCSAGMCFIAYLYYFFHNMVNIRYMLFYVIIYFFNVLALAGIVVFAILDFANSRKGMPSKKMFDIFYASCLFAFALFRYIEICMDGNLIHIILRTFLFIAETTIIVFLLLDALGVMWQLQTIICRFWFIIAIFFDVLALIYFIINILFLVRIIGYYADAATIIIRINYLIVDIAAFLLIPLYAVRIKYGHEEGYIGVK